MKKKTILSIKKLLFLALFLLSINSIAFADDNIQVENAEYKKLLMTNWLKSHPDKARELKNTLPNSDNPTEELQKWLDKNPEAARQLQQLVMPEGE